jgi:hypothetical protein
MWEVEKPRKKFKSATGEELIPLVTLEDDRNYVCHVVRDDDCYVAYLNAGDTGFFRTEYIFPELLEVLRGLPPLTNEVSNG